MNLKKRIVLLIVVMLLLGGSVALVATADDTAVGRTTDTLTQTATLAVLNQFAEPDCPPVGETFQ